MQLNVYILMLHNGNSVVDRLDISYNNDAAGKTEQVISNAFIYHYQVHIFNRKTMAFQAVI